MCSEPRECTVNGARAVRARARSDFPGRGDGATIMAGSLAEPAACDPTNIVGSSPRLDRKSSEKGGRDEGSRAGNAGGAKKEWCWRFCGACVWVNVRSRVRVRECACLCLCERRPMRVHVRACATDARARACVSTDACACV
eukprot:806629-Pleurochrysis_carterae.AAC.1